jgi:hypothetical protein
MENADAKHMENGLGAAARVKHFETPGMGIY